jgi:hypothetical protein
VGDRTLGSLGWIGGVGAAGLCLAAALGVAVQARGASGSAKPERAHVVGAAECAECHADEVQVWKRTPHYSHATTLPRSREARAISRALGVRRMKTSERCGSCHFTVQTLESGRRKALDGVSCESCHGAASSWVRTHSTFGSAGATRATETAEHRRARIAQSDRGGMNRPEELYALTATCYECHVVRDEELVKTGHPVGGELPVVSYTQGAMRHNFSRGRGKANPPSSRERQRHLYVVSRALELEYALRGLADARVPGRYADAMARLVRDATRRLAAVGERSQAREIREMVEVARRVPLAAGKREAALAAAKRVGAGASAIARSDRAPEFQHVEALLSRDAKTARADR